MAAALEKESMEGEGGGEEKQEPCEDGEKRIHAAWCLYESFSAKAIRKWTDKKSTFLEDSALLSPFVAHRRYFTMTRVPNDRVPRILQEKAKMVDRVPPMDLGFNDYLLDPEEISMNQLSTLEKLRFVYLLSENGQCRRSFLLNIFLTQLQKGMSAYSGKLASRSTLTEVEEVLNREERRLYDEESRFGKHEDINDSESAGAGRPGTFGYLGEGLLPLYISAPVFLKKFQVFTPTRVEGKSPGALKLLIESGVESLLDLQEEDDDFDYDSIFSELEHLATNPEVPLMLVVDGVEKLDRKDYGAFYHAIQLFAKIPPFVTEPPGIASVFMHDSLHRVDRGPPVIANPTRMIVSATPESIVTAKSLVRLDTRDWPFLELVPLSYKESLCFSRGMARYMGVKHKNTVERMSYSLVSRFAPHKGYPILLHLLAWHESRIERQNKDNGERMIWLKNKGGRRGNEAFHASLIDFVKIPPSLADDEDDYPTPSTGSPGSGLDDVYKDLLLCWIRKWWDEPGDVQPMPDDAAKWLLRLVCLFGYLNHWLEDSFLHLLDKFFLRDINSIYKVIGCEDPLSYLRKQMKAVIRVLGPISRALQERIEKGKFCEEEGNKDNDDEYGYDYFAVAVDLLESLVCVRSDRIEFFHPTFREYLTGLFLADEHVSLPIRDKLTLSSPSSASSLDDLRQSGEPGGISSSSPGPKTPDPTPSSVAHEIHAFLNPTNSHEYAPNPTVVKSVDYVPPPLPHFAWHLSTFFCSSFWRNVYVFAANSVPFGFLMVSAQLLQSFAEKVNITPSEGLLRSLGALFSNSFLPVMWGSRSNPAEYTSTFAAHAQSIGHSEANRNRIVIAAVVAEHCYQRESNPVWEYVNYFGSNANAEGKKGKNLLYDWDDIAYSRLNLLLQILGNDTPHSPSEEVSRRACFGQVVNCVLTDMGDDIRRFYMQVSGEEFSLESAKLWERAKDTFFGIEGKLFRELKDSTVGLFMETLTRDPEAICLLRGDARLASSLPIESLSNILHSLLDTFTHFSPSFEYVDPALASYILSSFPLTEYMKWIEVASEKAEPKSAKIAAQSTLSVWNTLLGAGGGVLKLEAGSSRDSVDTVSLFLRLIVSVVKKEGQQGFNKHEFQEFLIKLLGYLRKAAAEGQSDYNRLIYQVNEEAHSMFVNIAEDAYGEYEAAMLEFPAFSLSHPVFEARETPKFSTTLELLGGKGEEGKEAGKRGSRREVGIGLLHSIPLRYFRDVIRFAKYRLYHPSSDTLLVPGPNVGSVSVLSSCIAADQEPAYWKQLTKNLTSSDPLVRMATYFFSGDPHNFVEDTTDMTAVPLVTPTERGGAKKAGGVGGGSSSMVMSGVSVSGKKKGSGLPFNWGEEKAPVVRPLSQWSQSRDSTPILISLLNWLLCPLSVAKKYAAESAKSGKGEDRAFQERVMKVQQRQIEKAKNKGKKKKQGKSAIEMPVPPREEPAAWEHCSLDRVDSSLQWFLGRLFGAKTVACFSSLSFSSKFLNNAILRQLIRQVVLELPPTTAAHQFSSFFSLPLSRDFLREGFIELENLFQSPPLQYGPFSSPERAGSSEADPVDLCLADLSLLLLQEKLPVGVQDSLLSCLTSILWRVPKRHLSSVVRQFLRAVRSVLPRPVDEKEPLQHYVISPGHRMLFEVTILAFDSVACGVENKTVNPRTRARARLIVKGALKEQECTETLIAIAQAASSDKTTPSHCVASLLMLLHLAEATDAPVFGHLLKQLFERNCPLSRQKILFILSHLPSARVPQLLDVLLPTVLKPLPDMHTTSITLRHAIGVKTLALSALTQLVIVHPDNVLPILYHFLFEGQPSEFIPEAQRPSKHEFSSRLVQLFEEHMEGKGNGEAKRTMVRILWDVPPHLWAISMQTLLKDMLESTNSNDISVALDMVLAIATWMVRIRNRTSRFGYRGNLWASNSSFGSQTNSPLSLSLDSPREPENERVYQLLQEIGEMLKALTATVARLLAHGCLGCRSNAFRCLSTLGPIPGAFEAPATREVMISLLSYEDEDVVEMALRVVGTCVGDNSSGKMWSLQFDRKVLSYVIKATEHQSLMVKKATVKSFGSLLWTAQRMCERNNFDISIGEDDEKNPQVHPAAAVQKAKDCLSRLMSLKNSSIQLQVLKVLCEIPLVHANSFVKQVMQLCNREFSVPIVKTKAIFFFARTGVANEPLIVSTIFSVISYKEPEVLGECLSTLSAVGCYAALHIPQIIAKLRKKSETQIRRKLAMFLHRFDTEHRMIHHVSTIHTFSNRGLPSTRGAFAINFEKSWKGDVESFPCDIEGASQNLPLSRCPAAVEAARLDGWGLFPTSKIQALETLAQDGDYMISRTAVRILGQSAHLYIPILKKIIQFAFFNPHIQIQTYAFDIMGSVGARRPYLLPEIMSRCALLDANNPENQNGRGRTRIWQRLSSQWRLCAPCGKSHTPK